MRLAVTGDVGRVPVGDSLARAAVAVAPVRLAVRDGVGRLAIGDELAGLSARGGPVRLAVAEGPPRPALTEHPTVDAEVGALLVAPRQLPLDPLAAQLAQLQAARLIIHECHDRLGILVHVVRLDIDPGLTR